MLPHESLEQTEPLSGVKELAVEGLEKTCGNKMFLLLSDCIGFQIVDSLAYFGDEGGSAVLYSEMGTCGRDRYLWASGSESLNKLVSVGEEMSSNRVAVLSIIPLGDLDPWRAYGQKRHREAGNGEEGPSFGFGSHRGHQMPCSLTAEGAGDKPQGSPGEESCQGGKELSVCSHGNGGFEELVTCRVGQSPKSQDSFGSFPFLRPDLCHCVVPDSK
ncbi:hypothetical protein STEG23_007737 [Scotinomys teguina]